MCEILHAWSIFDRQLSSLFPQAIKGMASGLMITVITVVFIFVTVCYMRCVNLTTVCLWGAGILKGYIRSK